MFDRRLLGTLVIALLLALAGCSIPTDDQSQSTRNVSVTVMNDADRPYTVRTTIVSSEFDAVEITHRNGSTRRLEVSSITAIPHGTLRNATDFRIVGGTTQTRRDRLDPRSGLGTTYTSDSTNISVVYHVVTADGDRPSNWGVLQCGDTARMDVRITIDQSGVSDVVNRCSDGDSGPDN